MLTGRVPGTNMIVGLSRRLFEACRNLAVEDEQILAVEEEQVAAEIERGSEYGLFDLDEGVEKYARERRAAFVEREAAERTRLRETTRQGFERGQNNSWYQLLGREPDIDSNPAPGLLESATADTYLAIDRLSVVP
jgi:hypothetical protein